MSKKSLVVLSLVLFLAGGSLAHAQATRTWVSGVGDDANPCSRTAPCKTYAGAISKTAAGGEISTLDPGGFGAVTITKSITISGVGTLAGVLAAGTNGVIVNAGVNDVIILRDLQINGAGTGLNGIRFLAGGALHVENCSINGFKSASVGSGHGITFEPSGNGQLFVKDTFVQNNGTGANGGGILIKPGAAGTAKASLDNVQLEKNIFGLKVQDRSTVTITNSRVAGNAFAGITATSAGAAISLFVEQTASVNNGSVGIQSSGSNTAVRISNVTVTGNDIGLQALSSGQILSFDNNNVAGNITTQGAATGSITPE
jgi:hypothetical protein